MKIWQAKDNWRISVESDGEKFIAIINAGPAEETFFSVGYSCPNGALDKDETELIPRIAEKLDEFWAKQEEKEKLNDMLPTLLEMAKVANETYNDELWRNI